MSKLIKCISNTPMRECNLSGYWKDLTVGKLYKVEEENHSFYRIKTDTGQLEYIHKERFVEVEESSPQQEVEYYEVIKKVPLSGYKSGAKLHAINSFDEYAQYPEFFKPHYKAQYKAGDWVTAYGEMKSASRTFQVGYVDATHVWSGDPTINSIGPMGYPINSVRYATAKEIEAASAITIGEYKMEIREYSNRKTAEFGCKEFTSEELIAYRRLIHNDVTIVYKGEQITLDKLNKILDKLK